MENNIDKYTNKLFENSELMNPSENFTDNLMSKINLKLIAKPVVKVSFWEKYKFAVIFSLTFSIIFILSFLSTPISNSKKPYFNIFEKIPNWELNADFLKHFLNFEINTFYIILFTSIIILLFFDSIFSIIKNKKSSTF